ncbi:MAG: DMT family transporter [Halobacteriota archaeon]
MAWTTWGLLLLAIILEVAGTTCLKLADGFTKLLPSAGIFVFYALSFGALAFTLKEADLSIAYTVWAGLGTALIAVIGVLLFREPVTALKVASIIVVIFGVIGLSISGVH